MAFVRIAYTWPGGEQLEVIADSDLDGILDVGAAARTEFREAWQHLEPDEPVPDVSESAGP